MLNILTLIRIEPRARGVFEPVTEERRNVYCDTKSVGMNETYQAMAAGLAPEIRFVIPYGNEYHGEQLCEFGGVRYRVLRTYTSGTNEIELTCQREEGNACGHIPSDGDCV